MGDVVSKFTLGASILVAVLADKGRFLKKWILLFCKMTINVRISSTHDKQRKDKGTRGVRDAWWTAQENRRLGWLGLAFFPTKTTTQGPNYSADSVRKALTIL